MIQTNLLYSLAGLALVAGGFFALIARSHLLRKIMAANIMSSGVFLLLVTTTYRADGSAIDPVPHAMVLTGIVVSVSTTALALILACRVQETSNLTLLQAAQQDDNREEDGR